MVPKLAEAFNKLIFFRNHDIPEGKRLSQAAKISLVIHWCFIFGASMSGIFLNLYLWRLTHSLWLNGMFSIINFIAVPVAFAVGGRIAKKRSVLFTFRLGIMLIALFYLSVITAQEKVVDFYWLFAIFNGIASAFYWIGFLTLMYDVSTDHNRIRYLALNTITFTSATLSGPALAGFIISQFDGLRGYILVFTLAFIMFVVTTMISFRLKTSSQTHHRVYFLKYIGLLMRKNKRLHKALYAYFIFGTLQGIMLFLPNILLYKVIAREDLVGYAGVLYLGLGIISSYFISRYAKASLVRVYLLFASIGFITGASFLMWDISLYTVIIFVIFYYVFNPLQGNSIGSNYYNIISSLPLKGELRIESLVAREAFMNIGRILAIFLLITLSNNLDSAWLPWIVLVTSVAQIGMVWLIERES